MENNIILTTPAYEKNFWNYTKGMPNVADFIHQGRTTDTGSYRLPAESNEKYEKAVDKESAFRKIASIYTNYEFDSNIIATDNDDIGQFVPENGNIDIVNLATDFTKISVGNHKLVTLSRVSSELVNDASFDFASYFIKRMAQVFARTEDNAFINGSGNGEPTGILHTTHGAETALSTTAITFDDVVSLYFSVKAKYRKNAVWLMNDTTAMALRKLKDDAGNYLWNAADGTIFNKKVVISEYMPDIAAGAKPIAFGDFSYYWIVKRKPVTVKTFLELFAMRNQIGYLAFEFLDGKLIRREAVKVISIDAAK